MERTIHGVMRKKHSKASTPVSKMSREDKEFFRELLDTVKLFYRQREALFQICGSELKNWEPVYRIVQNEPEIVRKADELFAEMYESIEAGKRASFARFSGDLLTKGRPN